MRTARLDLSPRCLALVLALVLAASGLVALFPATAQAACSYDFTWHIKYYSDPGLTQLVGECDHTCDGTTSCWGQQTDNSQLTRFQRCPFPTCY